MITGMQVVGVIFVLVMSYFTYLYYKRKDYPRTDYIMWMLIWLTFLILVLFPYSTQIVLQPMGLAMNMHLYTIAGFMVAYAILFYQHDLLRKNEAKIGKLVREISIENAKRKK